MVLAASFCDERCYGIHLYCLDLISTGYIDIQYVHNFPHAWYQALLSLFFGHGIKARVGDAWRW